MREAQRFALVIIDMQNDFCDGEGAYARGGLDITPTRAILPRVGKAIHAARRLGMAQIGTLFTVFEGVDGTPLTSTRLLRNRPFLAEYGFRLGDQGHEFSRELPTPSHTVLKPRYSAFYGTPLEILLRNMG
ncbi:MAG: cysteine hydrolase family protein, partial [Bacilli bacterium]